MLNVFVHQLRENYARAGTSFLVNHLKIKIMENDKNKPAESETSSKEALERGKKAIEAEEKLNEKDPEDPKVKKEKEKDAEQWRNEG
jgi:hypothetical protein